MVYVARFIAIPMLLLLSACASKPLQISEYNHPALQQALSGKLIFQQKVTDDELPQMDLFGLTDEMKQFAAKAVKYARNQDEKAEALHKALMSSTEKGGRGIQYSALTTGTAKESFESSLVNCLGYTLLYVSLARHVGLDANVNQVIVPPTWFMDDTNAYFLMSHVNARVKIKGFSWLTAAGGYTRFSDVSDIIVDLGMNRIRSSYKQKVLNNDAVESIFYNNLAMERSTNGDDKNAFLYLKRALIANNNESFIWSNLGAIYRRRGDLQIAEVVYLKALSLNQQDYTVLHNLAVLYKKMGNQTKADFYQEQVQHYREQNPYYLYQMAKNAKSNGNIASAKNLITRALKKQIHDERFYLFAAELYETEGNIKQSKKMRDKAESLKQVSLNSAETASS